MQARNERSNSTGRRGWANLVPGVRSTARAVVAVSRLGVLGLLLQPVAVWATEYVWDHDGATSGTKDWSTAANWSGDTVPTFAAGDTLKLTRPSASGTATVNLDPATGNITLGTIEYVTIDEQNPFYITRSGAQVFNMNGGGSTAAIVWRGANWGNVSRFEVPIVLYSDLEFTNTMNRTAYLFVNNPSLGITSAGGLRTISNKSTGTSAGAPPWGTSIHIAGIIGDGAGQIKLVQDGTTASSMLLTGNNTFSGGVVVESGTIYATSAGMNVNDLTVNGGYFEPHTDASVKIGGLAGTGSGTVRTFPNASKTVEISPSSGSYTFAGVLADQGTGVLSVKKTGNGTQILSGASTYTGATAVSNGTLLVNGTLSGGGGTVTVNSGGALGGTGTIERAVQFEAGSAMAVNAAVTNQLTVNGVVTLDSSSELAIVGTLTEKTYTLLTATSVSGEFDAGTVPRTYAIAYTETTVTLDKLPAGTVIYIW